MKRNLLIVSVILCLAAMLACVSLAYFTASSSVKNKFMVASAEEGQEPDPDDIFSITVTEDPIGEEYGEPITDAEGKVIGNKYTEFLPGSTLPKKPVVTNTGAYDAYVRVKVSISKADEWKEALGGKDYSALLALFVDIQDDFTLADTTCKDDVVTFTYLYNGALIPTGTATLFTQVQIPTNLDTKGFAKIAPFEIDISADAIQAANTGDVANAFKLFDEQMAATCDN